MSSGYSLCSESRVDDAMQDRGPKRRTESSTEPAVTKNQGGCGDDNSDQDSHIPDLILSELLCRLQSKDVFRFKCVCKRWFSFISDPSFGSMYLSRQDSFQPSPFVIFDPEIGLFDDDEEEDHKSLITKTRTGSFPQFRKVNIPSLRKRLADGESGFQVVAADKGFLLLEKQKEILDPDNYIAEYYICNAVTKEWFTLPELRVSNPITKVGFAAKLEGCVVLTSYRVVILHSKGGDKKLVEAEMFSSEIGIWADLEVECPDSITISSSKERLRPPVVVNTTIYWLNPGYGILAYDPHSDVSKIRVIGRPGSELFPSECDEGRLKSVMYRVDRPPVTLTIWELNDNDMWEIQHSDIVQDMLFKNISPNGPSVILRNCFRAQLLSVHPFDPDVVFLYWRECRSLVSYNAKTNRMESLDEYWPSGGCDPMIGFFLVLPLWRVSFHPFLSFGSDEWFITG